jgi:hypothetical protein
MVFGKVASQLNYMGAFPVTTTLPQNAGNLHVCFHSAAPNVKMDCPPERRN